MSAKFKVYGNYCGPGYCGGSYAEKCDYSVKPIDHIDSVCKEHDRSYESLNNKTRRDADLLAADRLMRVNSPVSFFVRNALRTQGFIRGFGSQEPEIVSEDGVLSVSHNARSNSRSCEITMLMSNKPKRGGRMDGGRPSDHSAAREPSYIYQYGTPTASDFVFWNGSGSNNPCNQYAPIMLPFCAVASAFPIEYTGKCYANTANVLPVQCNSKMDTQGCLWRISEGGLYDIDFDLLHTFQINAADFSSDAATLEIEMTLFGIVDPTATPLIGAGNYTIYQYWTTWIGANVVGWNPGGWSELKLSHKEHARCRFNFAYPYVGLGITALRAYNRSTVQMHFSIESTSGPQLTQIINMSLAEVPHAYCP